MSERRSIPPADFCSGLENAGVPRKRPVVVKSFSSSASLVRPKSITFTDTCAVIAECIMRRQNFRISREHDVRRLQIAMNETAFLGRGQGERDLQCDLERQLHAKRSDASQTAFERFTVDELHRVEAITAMAFFSAGRFGSGRRIVGRAKVKNTGDIGMTKLCRGLGFMQKAPARLRSG